MNNTQLLEHEDVGEALRKGRQLRPARAYRIRYAQGDVNFRTVEVPNPVPIGAQVLAAAGVNPGGGYSLFAILANGDFEDVRMDEPFDLRERGAERFVAFQTDRSFKLTLNDRQLEWGKPAISGTVLYKLASAGSGDSVFLRVPGAEDRLIEPSDVVDLTAPGIEKFFTGPKPVQTYEIFVNSRPRVIEDKIVTFEKVVELAFPGPQGPNIVFSMTYRHAESKPHAGELGPGGSVEVKKKGTIFNVTKTDKS
jgi:hypothetical protein